MTFNDLGLRPEILKAIADAGYTTPTPIQEKAIPAVLTGVDVLGCAQTGTGKTAAFVLPILQRLAAASAPGAPAAGRKRQPRALVVTPTRELAAQVQESVRDYGRHLPIKSAAVFGGVGMVPQAAALLRADIVVATPGRLLDHVQRGNVSFSALEVLVLDEADRMLDMGFLPDVRRILALLPGRRQNLLFSATMPREVEELIRRTLREPTVVEVTPRASTIPTVRQVVHAVSGEGKRDLLCHLLERGEMRQVLVFTRTKARADRLAKHLSRTRRKVAAIHGNKSQGARTAALDGFKNGRIDTLVATDIAARGIDVDGISHVVNFDVPFVPEDYVHRIGRTARAGASGNAITLVASEEAASLKAIERLIGQSIPREAVPGFGPGHGAPTAAPFAGAAPGHRPMGGGGPRPAPAWPRRPGPRPVRSYGHTARRARV